MSVVTPSSPPEPVARRDRALMVRAVVRSGVGGRRVVVFIAAATLALLFWGVVTKQWFAADEWAILVGRGRVRITPIRPFLDVLLRPHNEHWFTLPIIVYRAIFGVVGLRAYWPYLFVSLAVHGTVVLLLHRRLIRSAVVPGVALVLTATMLFHGAGAENIWWAFQMGWMGSLAFGLWHLELVGGETTSIARIRLGWVVGIAAIMCTGLGVTMAVVVGMSVFLRRGWRSAAQAVWPIALVQLAYLATYGRTAHSPRPLDLSSAPHELLPYVWRALISATEKTIGLPYIGALALVALAIAGMRRWPLEFRSHSEVYAMALGAVVFLCIVALGRIGIDNEESSRYAYVAFLLLAPLVGRVASAAWQRRDGVGRPAVALLGGLMLFSSTALLLDAATREGSIENDRRDQVLAGFALARSGYGLDGAVPELNSANLTMGSIRALLAQGRAPSGRPSKKALALARSLVSIDLTGQPRVPLDPAAVDIRGAERATLASIESGCVRITPTGPRPQIVLVPRRPASFKIVTYVAGGSFALYADPGTTDGVGIPVKAFAEYPVFINMSDPRITYVVEVPEGGRTNVCGLGQTVNRQPIPAAP